MADRKQNKEPTPPPLLLMSASQGLTFDGTNGSNMLMPIPQTEASLMTGDEDGEADSFLGQSPPKGLGTMTAGPPLSMATIPPVSKPGAANNYFQSHADGNDPFTQIQQPIHPGSTFGGLPPSMAGPTGFQSPARGMAPPHGGIAPPSTGGIMPPSSIGIAPPPGGMILPPGAMTNHPSGMAPPPGVMAPPPGGMTIPPGGMPPPTVGGLPPAGPAQNYHKLSKRPQYAQPPAGTYASPAGSQPSSTYISAGPPLMSGEGGAYSSAGPPPISVGGGPYSYQEPPPSSSSSSSSFGGQPPGTGNPYSSNSGLTLASPGSAPSVVYIPVQYHWFYSKNVELRYTWKPFSMVDSINLEEAFRSGAQDNVVVSTDGGRYDVDIIERSRSAIYWDEPDSYVRRTSWFYRPDGDNKFLPFEENIADRLEEIYKMTLQTNDWHRRHDLPNNDVIVMHNPQVFVSFQPSAHPDEYGTTQGDVRPRVVKRGIEEVVHIPEGEPIQIDHIVFVVHGIGPTCDLKFRNIIECVDDFRCMSLQMCQSHFGSYQEEGRVGRVEFLPVRWHRALHGDATGVDRKLKAITLNSIGKLRSYTNDTLLDILFYTSPTYSQQIADTVGAEMNRLFDLFKMRNSAFKGDVSVTGHSLGSLILFDLLTHQEDPNSQAEDARQASLPTVPSSDSLLQDSLRESTPTKENGDLSQSEGEVESLEELLSRLGLTDYQDTFNKEEMDLETLALCEEKDIKEMGIPLGPRKKIQGFLRKHQQKKDAREKAELAALEAEKNAQDVLNSSNNDSQISRVDPILRSVSSTSVDYMQGECGTGIPYIRYPQLSFSPLNFFALGSPISMFLTVRGVDNLGDDFHFPTCPGFFNIFHPFDPVAYRIEPMISSMYPPKPYQMPHHKGRKRLHLELKESLSRMGSDLKNKMMSYFKTTWKTINDFALAHKNSPQEALEQEMNTVMSQMPDIEDDAAETASIASMIEEDIHIGSLNQGRRIDIVLQEKPIESFNDYLFALGSHGCYWESEDTVLHILKEVYSVMGIQPIRPGTVPFMSPQTSPLGSDVPIFPRHPMASAGISQSMMSPAMVAPPSRPGSAVSYAAPPLGAAPAGSGPAAATGAPVAPPPLMGFVRK